MSRRRKPVQWVGGGSLTLTGPNDPPLRSFSTQYLDPMKIEINDQLDIAYSGGIYMVSTTDTGHQRTTVWLTIKEFDAFIEAATRLRKDTQP